MVRIHAYFEIIQGQLNVKFIPFQQSIYKNVFKLSCSNDSDIHDDESEGVHENCNPSVIKSSTNSIFLEVFSDIWQHL